MSFSEHLTKTVAAVGLNMVGDTTGWAAPVCIVDAPSGFGEEIWTGAQPETVLTVPLGGATVVAEIRGFEGLRSNLKERRMALQAQGANDQYRCQGGTRFAHFYLRAPLVARVAEGLEAHAFAIKDLRHDLIMFKDDTLWRRLTSYAERSTCRREPASRIEMEARALLVVDRLIGAHHLGREANPLKGGLAPWQVRRTQDAMAAQLDAEISLDALAAVAGCSPTHFSRAFKQSVGVPPFAWLHERRMERAKELLCENVLSLAEIALAVGFSAQPQFTTAFGKATGATPGAWRRARRE